MSAKQTLRDAQRISEFLKDPIIDAAMSRMERRYYEDFIHADTPEKRVTARAKALVLRDWETEMKIVLDAGEKVVLEAAKAVAQPKKE